MKIINQHNGFNNELKVMDPCPKCGAEVTGISLNYATSPVYDYGEPTPVWLSTSGNFATFEPCTCQVNLAEPFMKDWTIYRFPKTKEGKAGYNAQVSRRAIAAVRGVS